MRNLRSISRRSAREESCSGGTPSRQRIQCSIHRTRRISFTDGGANYGYGIQTFWSGRSSERRSSRAQVRMSEAPRLLILPETEPNAWNTNEEAVVLLERNLYGHLVAGACFGKRRFGRFALEAQVGKSTNLGISLLPMQISSILVRMPGLDQCGTFTTRHRSGRSNFLLKQVYLGCKQREAEVDHEAVQPHAVFSPTNHHHCSDG